MIEVLNKLDISSSPLINAAFYVLLFIVFAKIIDILIDKVFRRFSRFTKIDIDDKLIDVIHRPIYLTIIIIGCVLAIAYLKAAPEVVFYLNNSLYSVTVVIWAVTVMRIANVIVEFAIYKSSDETGLRSDIIPLVQNVLKLAIFVATLMVILSIWQVNITPLLASAGIAGVAVALAAKDTLSNFFGGISVFMDRPYKIGDYIILDSGERGEVVAIGVRSTRIKTRDDVLITIPNSVIANAKITNESAPIPNFRVRIPASVAYGSDIDLVEKTLLEIASENNFVVPQPEPRVRFREFGDSSLNFELLCWVEEPALKGRTVHSLNSMIYKRFNELGIIIPFPQRDLHIYQR